MTGGRNGFGAKLTNIFSTDFEVETYDAERGLHFRQSFSRNMTRKGEPEIVEEEEGDEFTCITFKPDLKRFHMTVRRPQPSTHTHTPHPGSLRSSAHLVLAALSSLSTTTSCRC